MSWEPTNPLMCVCSPSRIACKFFLNAISYFVILVRLCLIVNNSNLLHPPYASLWRFRFWMGASKSASGRFLVIDVGSKETSECHVVDLSNARCC